MEAWDEGIVYLLITDKNLSAHVAMHSCWNKTKFVETQRAAHAKEGATVAVVDRQAYRNYRKGLH